MSNDNSTKRLANWDLLRSIAMFLVVVVHTSGNLGLVGNFDAGYAVGTAAFLCDPLFFVLSGYFALGPIKRCLKSYYINKVITILLPLVLYSLLLYLAPINTSMKGDLSVGGYFQYFADLLRGGWWFIPTLIPYLVAAPFLSKGLEALSDKAIFDILKVLGVLSVAGILYTFFQWAFALLGAPEMVDLCALFECFVPPSMLTQNLMYLQFFILGGLFKRIEPIITHKAGNILIAIGAIAWLSDDVWALLGIPRNDPSYFWVFATFGVMILFSRLRINNEVLCSFIGWTAKRSYSIYLLQYTTIAIASFFIYSQAIFGDVSYMHVLARIALWIGFVVASYALALLIASVVDSLILIKLQRILKKKLLKPAIRGL